ncbi:hypothetical protein AgCh_027549 [Apium graveolens]
MTLSNISNKTVEARVHASEPVIVEAENITSQKETAAQSSDTLKKKSVSSEAAKATPSLARRLKKMKAMSVSVETPVPILGKEELVKKFVEQEAPIPWEDTHRGVEWTKKWNDTDFNLSSNILIEHIAKADELLTNADLKTQLKITALSTKHLQEKQHAQIAEVLANQVSQKAQLDEIQSSVELLLSLLLPDDAKKVEKVVKSKYSPTEILKKKDDKSDDQGNSDKSRGQEKVQGNSSTQNKSSSDAVNAKSLKSSSDKQRMDLETLKEEEARFAAKKTNLKSKASDAKKPPIPKEKGISKGKEKVGEPLKIEKKISSSIPVYQTTVHDDDLIEDEIVQILKRRKIIEESKTTSETAQVVQNKEQQVTEETTNSDQVNFKKMTIADKKKLLWKKATPVEPKSNLLMNQLATFGLRSKQPRDKA